MKPSIAAKLEQLSMRLEEINRLLTSETVTADMDNYRKLTREHAELGPVVELYRSYQASQGDLNTAQEMAADPASASSPRSSLPKPEARIEDWKPTCRSCCCRVIPTTSATYFSRCAPAPAATSPRCSPRKLFRMYARYAERKRWQVEVISESPSDLGGYREIIARIIGAGAYSN